MLQVNKAKHTSHMDIACDLQHRFKRIKINNIANSANIMSIS